MSTEALKTTAVTNLDAFPMVSPNVAGKGSLGDVQSVFGSVTATTASDIGSTYQMVRLSSAAVISSIEVWLDSAVTTFTADITVYYSSSNIDGTDVTKRGTLVTAHVFKTAVALAAIVAPTQYFKGGNITGSGLGKKLWDLCGLTSDPGGRMDITLVTTAAVSGAPVINMQVSTLNP